MHIFQVFLIRLTNENSRIRVLLEDILRGIVMEEKFAKVYKILKWIMLLIFIICLLLLFVPQSVIPFDVSEFRSYASLWIFLVLLISFSSFIYFLIYPALEKFKKNLRDSLFEETQQKFDDVNKQIEELKKQVEDNDGGNEHE